MPKNRPMRQFGSRFDTPGAALEPQACTWAYCQQPQFAGLPVCIGHGLTIARHLQDCLIFAPSDHPDYVEPVAPLERQPFVYYLMIGPDTVKIGTTVDLRGRLNGLRTDQQYVVAIEHGGRELERQRHLQFAATRIGRRENFRLSDELRRHIESLQPERDDLMSEAVG